jgi:hypothetical protein
MSQLIYNAIRTPDGTVLHSRHRHDYVEHLDAVSGELYINDGGKDYQRRSVNTVPATELSLTMDAPHEVKRQVVTWKSYGKDGEFPEGKIMALADMTSDHIRAILDTQYHIHGTYLEQLFADELEWRSVEGTEDHQLDAFSEWMLVAKSSTIGPNSVALPLLTEILYKVCANDEEKFKQVCDMMQVAFEAGQQSKE